MLLPQLEHVFPAARRSGQGQASISHLQRRLSREENLGDRRREATLFSASRTSGRPSAVSRSRRVTPLVRAASPPGAARACPSFAGLALGRTGLMQPRNDDYRSVSQAVIMTRGRSSSGGGQSPSTSLWSKYSSGVPVPPL